MKEGAKLIIIIIIIIIIIKREHNYYFFGESKTKKKIERGQKYYFGGTKISFWRDKFIKLVDFLRQFKKIWKEISLDPQAVGSPLMERILIHD